MSFEPMKYKCPICNNSISCEMEIDSEDELRLKKVSDWVCNQGHIIEDKELLERLEDLMKSLNLTSS